jgi:hypothetical protein
MKYSINALKNNMNNDSDVVKTENHKVNANRYRFWNIEKNDYSLIRFLPDRNEENPLFFISYKTHDILYRGSKRTFNCLSNYNEPCPICEASSEYFRKDGKNSIIGKDIYKKQKYLAQIIVLKDATTGSNKPFYASICFGKQIHDAIVRDINSNKLSYAPHDPAMGYHFMIIHKELNNNSSYESSQFLADNPLALTEECSQIMEKNYKDLGELRNVKHDREFLLLALHEYCLTHDKHYDNQYDYSYHYHYNNA